MTNITDPSNDKSPDVPPASTQDKASTSQPAEQTGSSTTGIGRAEGEANIAEESTSEKLMEKIRALEAMSPEQKEEARRNSPYGNAVVYDGQEDIEYQQRSVAQ